MAETKLRAAVICTGMIANSGHIQAWKHLEEDGDLAAVAIIRSGGSLDETAALHGISKVYDAPQRRPPSTGLSG